MKKTLKAIFVLLLFALLNGVAFAKKVSFSDSCRVSQGYSGTYYFSFDIDNSELLLPGTGYDVGKMFVSPETFKISIQGSNTANVVLGNTFVDKDVSFSLTGTTTISGTISKPGTVKFCLSVIYNPSRSVVPTYYYKEYTITQEMWDKASRNSNSNTPSQETTNPSVQNTTDTSAQNTTGTTESTLQNASNPKVKPKVPTYTLTIKDTKCKPLAFRGFRKDGNKFESVFSLYTQKYSEELQKLKSTDVKIIKDGKTSFTSARFSWFSDTECSIYIGGSTQHNSKFKLLICDVDCGTFTMPAVEYTFPTNFTIEKKGKERYGVVKVGIKNVCEGLYKKDDVKISDPYDEFGIKEVKAISYGEGQFTIKFPLKTFKKQNQEFGRFQFELYSNSPDYQNKFWKKSPVYSVNPKDLK
ncbi:MAG: hypothetical protein K6B43_03635 [Treponema sp.]|nr:hypothetical protein [Treponema sp.]